MKKMNEMYEVWCGVDYYTQKELPPIKDYMICRTTSNVVAYAKLEQAMALMKAKSQDPANKDKRFFAYLIHIDLTSVLYYLDEKNNAIPRYESHCVDWFNYSQREDVKLWKIVDGVKYDED